MPYLLNVALAITEYLSSFPPAPRPTFTLLKKLDHCFASLLQGKDIRSGEILPGFEGGMAKGMTRTDMVRLRSLADETRSQVAIKMSGEAEVDTAMFLEDSESYTPLPHTMKRKASTAEEEDDETSDSVSPSLSPKRQKTVSPAQARTVSPINKPEDSVWSPTWPASEQVGHGHPPSEGGQFHWALEEDSDDDQSSPASRSVPEASRAGGRQITPLTDAKSPGSDTHSPPPTGHHAIDSAEDEEEQELHMSVAKVFEKTIVQLGRTLGETLVDE